MANQDGGWRPKGAMETYKGFEIWDHNMGPHQYNPAQTDPEWTDREDANTVSELDRKAGELDAETSDDAAEPRD